MRFRFCRKYNSKEKAIEIVKPNVGDNVTFLIHDDDSVKDQLLDSALKFEELAARYNYAMIGNDRELFDRQFPTDFKDLVRVIGITNTLGNYFTFFNNKDISIEAFKSYINDIKGFVFVDWDVVSKKEQGSQFLYVTTDEETNNGESELRKYYESGSIISISYEISEENGVMYCIDSSFLNRGRTPFINGLRNKVHQILLKKFPE